nr:MAG TPA: Toxin SymE, type I toxin-antitoxin system [Caudoviricetes sp.]
MIRPLKDNGKCGSKYVTFPKSVIDIAEFSDMCDVVVEVEKGKITLRKECKNEKEVKPEN